MPRYRLRYAIVREITFEVEPLPEAEKANIGKHLDRKVDEIMSQVEMLPGDKITPLGLNIAPDSGARVHVQNGDQTEDLGFGSYLGEVDVHFISMPDGSIMSEDDAEQPLSRVPEGGTAQTTRSPKIRLDNGRIVYGCQVWWELAEPEAKAQA